MKLFVAIFFVFAAWAQLLLFASCTGTKPGGEKNSTPPFAVEAKTMEYKHGDTVCEGFMAWPVKADGKRPGVLLVHEWKGVNEHVTANARRLAELGYVALAADIYGKGVRPQTNEAAAKEAGKYRGNRALLRARAQAALDVLKADPRVDASRVVAIGYCFGGGTVLELSRSGADVRGVVSFHGNLDTPNPADARAIRGRVLVCHGAADPFVKQDSVVAFEKEMTDAGVNYRVIQYPGAVHSFTNPAAGNDPSQGAAYNKEADEKSWADMLAFFAEVLK